MLYVVFNFVAGNDDDGVQHFQGEAPGVGADSHDVQCNVNPVDSVLCITLSCSLKDGFQA